MPALTFMTTYSPDPTQAPYADGVGEDGFPRYTYQGTAPGRADNVSMKLAVGLGKPLVWFVGTGEGVYAATDRDLLAQRHARFITYGGART
jgi:hypothetical protein